MKIGFVLPHDARMVYGGFKVVFEYADHLVGNGHEVVIYFMMDRFLSKFDFIPATCRSTGAKWMVSYHPKWFTFQRSVRKVAVFTEYEVEENDVIVATAIRTAYFVQSLGMEKGKKAYFIQDFENWKYSDEQVYETYGFGMLNITVSEWLTKLVDQYGKKPAVCVSNSIDTRVFQRKVPLDQRRAHSVTFHYRSAEMKGCKYAIEAIRMLQTKYPALEVTVVSVEKKPSDLPERCRFVHRATAQEVAEINNRSQLFLCASINEGFGLPGLEAMACGCALVSARYQGVLEYAENNVNALLCEPRSAEALAENVTKLFETPELLKTIAENGHSTAMQRSLEVAAKRFESILEAYITEKE